MVETASPGVRFARLGNDMKPLHMLDAWFMADADSYKKYSTHPIHYLDLWREVDDVLGKSAKFIFIGELDAREDLSPQHRLSDILADVGVDIMRPIAASVVLGVSLHQVKRWPGYYVLLRGMTAERGHMPMTTYVFRYAVPTGE